MMRAPAILALSSLSAMPGCIAWEIRDEIRATNQHLCEVKPALLHTLHSVEETNLAIAKTQAQLAEVQASLAQTRAHLASVHDALNRTDGNLVAVGGTLGQTNPRLGEMQDELERMRILGEVNTTLKDVHATLGPLSSAMGSLGGAMSWLGMGGDAPADLLAAEADAPSAAATEPDGTDAGADGKRAEPILGTWVMVYPPPAAADHAPAGPPGAGTNTMGRITIFSADGGLLFSETGKPIRSGRWTRQGRTLTFALDPLSPGGPPETATGELLTLNARTLTIRRGDVITVHARP